jgi:hypothetical protein
MLFLVVRGVVFRLSFARQVPAEAALPLPEDDCRRIACGSSG